MSTDIKLGKTQMSKMIQSGGILPNMLGNLGKKVIRDLTTSFTRYDLTGLVSKLASNAISKFKRSCESRKRIYFIYFE